MKKNLPKLSEKDLLILHADINEELKSRKVVRTRNNPVGDYTEWVVANALDLELATNSSTGYDGIDKNGVRYQIKGRRITPDNKSRQLSAIRKLEDNDFDYLVVVIFDRNYKILEAVMMPHEVVGEYATYKKHVNAHILHLRGAILEDSRVTHITNLIDG